MPTSMRLIYNCDGNCSFIYQDPPVTPEGVHPYVDEVVGTGVTTFFMSPHVGMVMNYPGGVTEMLGEGLAAEDERHLQAAGHGKPASLERNVAVLRSLVAAGHDPLGLMLGRARERGLETFITFRLNECHCVDTPDKLPEKLLLARYWREHPEWHIGRAGDPLPQLHLDILGPRTHPIVAGWLPRGLDFAVPEVRALRLAELRECAERYPIDGLDLDFQRFPMYFRPGEEERHLGTMTAWVAEVRAMTRQGAARRGRPLLLSARIMARPEQNTGLGLDPIRWVREGLLDFVTVSHYLRNDFPLPVAEYRRLLPDGFPLYASIEVEPGPERYRQIAAELWAAGVDGLMLFNFFTWREGGNEPPFGVIGELGRPRS